MEKIELEMPVVIKCGVKECAYNLHKNCHAKAITVGDSVNPDCDTFLHSTRHTQEMHRIAGVGACKVTGCIHNRDFECGAPHITVDREGGKVHCLTYAPKAA